jgi:eukaryotic-like serine/threonine-protein kinase
LKKSIALRPSVDACSNLGTAYFSLRRFSDAADNFQQATKINDRNMTAWGNLGDALYWTPSRRAESKAAYDKALELGKAQEALNPRDGETLAMMADYYAMTGQKAEAMDSLQKAVRLEPKNSEVLFRAALVYNHFGQTTEALQWLQKAIEAGYSRSEVRDFPDFDSLQSNPQFRALLANN